MDMIALLKEVDAINSRFNRVFSEKINKDDKNIEKTWIKEVKKESKEERRYGEKRKKETDNPNLGDKLKPKEEKKKKDIIKIIDDSDKHKEDFDQDVEDITLKMDGFERIHLEQYQKHLDQYKRFLATYLEEGSGTIASSYAYQTSDDKPKKREFSWGQEVVTYGEIKDIVRRVHMNALLGGNSTGTLSGHNQIAWQEAEDFKFWKYTSKFNEMMSMILYDQAGSGG